jgi:hypothetical protein
MKTESGRGPTLDAPVPEGPSLMKSIPFVRQSSRNRLRESAANA